MMSADGNAQKMQVEIANELGLHARASAKLTQVATGFPCDIWLSYNKRRVNAKSIMGVMMLAATKGSIVELEATGEQSSEALFAIRELVQQLFGEGK